MAEPTVCAIACIKNRVREKTVEVQKNVFTCSPRTTWDREDWIREMAKPASEGGMGCSELDSDANSQNYVRQCTELAREELPDDMNVAVAVAQDTAAILRYVRKAPKRRGFPAWGIPAEALLLISDRQCNIETPDTTTNRLQALKDTARKGRPTRTISDYAPPQPRDRTLK